MNNILAVLLSILMITSTNFIQSGNMEISRSNTYFEEEYLIEPTEVNLILLSFDDFIRKYESNESYIIMITKATCPYCQSLLPKYISVSEEMGITEMFFLDTESMSVDEKKLLVNKFELPFVPTVFIRNPDKSLRTEIGDMDIEYVREVLLPFMKGE